MYIYIYLYIYKENRCIYLYLYRYMDVYGVLVSLPRLLLWRKHLTASPGRHHHLSWNADVGRGHFRGGSGIKWDDF